MLDSLNLSLFDTPTAPKPAPAAVDPQPEAVTVCLRKTRFGRDILICTADQAPQHAIDQAAKRSLPLFTSREITVMRGCPDQMVAKIIDAKLVFPGCSVSQIIQEAGA